MVARSSPVIEVLAPGLLTTVQDTRGRLAWARFGVAEGGALDIPAAAAANRLCGNAPDAALLEITFAGPVLRFQRMAVIGLAGADLGALLDGREIAAGASYLVRRGSLLAFGERRRGTRVYLAIAGGLDVPAVLGSRSTDCAGGFGGLAGRALRAGDSLAAFEVSDSARRAGARLADPAVQQGVVRILPGPHADRFVAGALERLCGQPWRIGALADRMGYRLEGQPLRHRRGADVPSLGLPAGAIQVPGDGLPIVLLADHQPTGGYTVLACVIQADLPILAQCAPGDTVRFALTSYDEARAALAAAGPSIDTDSFGWELAAAAGSYPPPQETEQ